MHIYSLVFRSIVSFFILCGALIKFHFHNSSMVLALEPYWPCQIYAPLLLMITLQCIVWICYCHCNVLVFSGSRLCSKHAIEMILVSKEAQFGVDSNDLSPSA